MRIIKSLFVYIEINNIKHNPLNKIFANDFLTLSCDFADECDLINS